jgi:hypothetical protein
MRALLLAVVGLTSACGQPHAPAPQVFDPLALARATAHRTHNREATVPPQCYTRTDGRANPCWVCHTASRHPNHRNDWDLQTRYAFSDAARTNRWANALREHPVAPSVRDDVLLRYVREDNYTPLRVALARRADYPGYRPDLDLHGGFDAEGFARDGSAWRAVRYKPFPGAFWPTNGSTDDVMIRLPARFRRDEEGVERRAVYQLNLALVEAALTSDPAAPLDRAVEPVSEVVAGVDLDGDGSIRGTITRIRTLPPRYVGGASAVALVRGRYPEGTEFLHTVRYLDPDASGGASVRLKELRYGRKVMFVDDGGLLHAYEEDQEERERGRPPQYAGSGLVGYRNAFGWQWQGFIEDARGRLRAQTDEEHQPCMGCHTSLGVTADQTFAFARKVPGADGWRPQDLRGQRDVPLVGHDAPEVLTYFRRALAGDELRANREMLTRYFRGDAVDEGAVRAAPDLFTLLYPSRARALDLNRAYLGIVRAQSFYAGRDVALAPPAMHRVVTDEDTGLAASGRVYRDGVLWLRW